MENNLIGTFISIPAWKTFGVVIGQETAQTGSNDAVRVLVQDHPDRPDLAGWYNLEPGEFEVDG